MLMGFILLQPTKFKQAKEAGPSLGLVGDLLDLILRIVADRVKKGDVFKILEEAAGAAGERFVQQVYKHIDKAGKRIQNLLKPLLKSLDDFGKTLPDTDDAAEVIDFALKLITKLTEKSAKLSVDQLRQPVAELLDIFQNELGLTGAFIEQQVWALVDDLIDRLEKASTGSNNGEGKNCRQMALVLRRFKRSLFGQFTFPGFNADQLAGDLLNLLRPYGIDTVVKKTACYSKNVGDIVSAAGSVAKLVPYAGFGPNTVGAAEASKKENETHLWYASWIEGKSKWKGYDWFLYIFFMLLMTPYPNHGFYILNKKLVCKKFFKSPETLADVDPPENWAMAEPFKKYSFSEYKAKTVEAWARHTGYPCDFIEVLLHGFSIEVGDWLSNVLYMSTNLTDAIYKTVTSKPFYPQAIFTARFLAPILGALPGIYTKANSTPAFVHWLSMAGANGYEAFLDNSLVHALRNALLSVITLLNHNHAGGEFNPAENYKEVGGLVSLINGLMTSQGLIRLVKHILKKENYGFTAFKKKTGDTLGLWLGLGTVSTFLSVCIGVFVGQIFARNFNKKLWEDGVKKVWWKQLLISLAVTWASYWPSFYTSEEGQTDEGKYNPTSDKKFDGYPGKSKSPYKLPFEKGKKVRCHQGNQGIWSHNNFKDDLKAGETPEDIFKYSSLVYAYDFDLDHNEKVLASRGGTVVDFFDWVPDNEEKTVDAPAAELKAGQTSKSNCNFIVIRHDDDPSDPGIDPAAHDKGEGGAKVTTYGVYGRGSKGSVRKALGNGKIIGKKVKQGDLIMRAGHTGDGWFNHLHIDVRPGPAAPASTTDETPVPWAQLEKRTIPFVFKDAEHKAPLEFFLKLEWLKDDGVPRSLNWYESDNG